MARKQSGVPTSGLTKRDLLGFMAMGVGFLAASTVLGKLMAGSRRNAVEETPLPGEGSIFQPRRDARLAEWEQRHTR